MYHITLGHMNCGDLPSKHRPEFSMESVPPSFFSVPFRHGPLRVKSQRWISPFQRIPRENAEFSHVFKRWTQWHVQNYWCIFSSDRYLCIWYMYIQYIYIYMFACQWHKYKLSKKNIRLTCMLQNVTVQILGCVVERHREREREIEQL